MPRRSSLLTLIACAIFALAAPMVLADTWVCPQPDGAELYTDRAEPGCRKLGGDSSVQIYKGASHHPSFQMSSTPAPSLSPKASLPSMPAKLKSRPIPSTTRQVPILLVHDLPSSVREKGFYLADRGEIALVDLRIAYVADGTGPRVSSDDHFQETSRMALETAVYAAAKAMGYDPQFLEVRLSIQTVLLQRALTIDGPSAGAMWAVAVASAILGDSIRPDVCMSGAITGKLEVGPVGGLEEKIKGCRQLNFREMIIPSDQTSTDLFFKGKGYEIKLTEVRTLAEAYAAATGQPLRVVE